MSSTLITCETRLGNRQGHGMPRPYVQVFYLISIGA